MPFADRPVRQVAKCDAASRLSILSVNVEESNREADRVTERVRETDPWWDEKLAVLEDMFPHSVAAITANTFGMHLFSKLPLLEPDIRREVGSPVTLPRAISRLLEPDIRREVGSDHYPLYAVLCHGKTAAD